MTIESILAELKENRDTVPQPYGAMVSKAYSNGLLDHSTTLHVLAMVLGKLAERD